MKFKDKAVLPPSALAPGLVTIKDIIAPSAVEVDFNYLRINNRFHRTFYVVNYPRYVSPNWLSPLVNFDRELDIAMYIYPVEGKGVLDEMRKTIARMEAEISTDIQRGKVVDPTTQAKLEDALSLQEKLAKGVEKFFQFGLYITVSAESVAELDRISKELQASLGALMIIPKTAILEMEEGFRTVLPLCKDDLNVTRNMPTATLSTTFPFVSSELSDDKGIMYGINQHNGSLVVFDRFTMENYNTVVFAKSGAGKSLAGFEPVLIRQDGEIKLTAIGPLINKLMKKHKTVSIDEEIKGVIFPPGLEVYTFNSKLKTEWSKVTVAARKVAPDDLYQITTASGRQMTITGDHNLVVLKNGELNLSKGEAVTTGEFVPLARQIGTSASLFQKVNLLKLLEKSPNLFVYNAVPLMTQFREQLKGKKHSLFCYFYKYVQDRGVPISFFNWCCEQTQIKLSKNQLKDIYLGTRVKQNKCLSCQLKIDKELAFFLGLIVAEGTVQSSMIAISSGDKKLLKKAAAIGRKLGFNSFSPHDKEIRFASRLLAQIVISLGIGQKAGNKKVPEVIFSSPKEIIAELIKGYFEGDGTVEAHQVSATSKSKELISQLSYLLNYFGIVSRIRKVRKQAVGSKKPKKRTYWQLTVSGKKHLQNFVDNISFFSQRKKKALANLLTKLENTNVDIVPELQSLFSKLAKILYPTTNVAIPTAISALKRRAFNPSPAFLKRVIKDCEKRIDELEKWQTLVKPRLENLPAIEEMIGLVSNDKELNAQAWQALGSSWAVTKKKKVKPKLKNALIVSRIAVQTYLTPNQVVSDIKESFKVLGVYQKDFSKGFFSALNRNPNANLTYQKVFLAKKYVLKTWEERKQKIQKAKMILSQLRTLAESSLFWDPITKVKKLKNNRPWVYDLTVDNGVFLAGRGGMFVHNSYMIKLETLRSLMFDTEVMVIDPENEYETLCQALGGQYITFGFNSPAKINPFDLELIKPEEGENELTRKILSLYALFRIIMGKMSPQEEAILDRGLVATYKNQGITMDPETQTGKEMPLIEDLYKVLIGMEEETAASLAARLEKFIKGAFAGLFNTQTNINIENKLVVFGTQDLEEALRPIAMHIILDFIWNKVRKELKRRVLVIDEAWYLMRYPDSARFLFGVAKRARKYYLGLTTVTQDVDDFLTSKYGGAIVKNSSIQILLKQHPAAIDQVGDLFYLSQGERQFLLAANIGEGIFFAGQNHVAIRIIASPQEHKLITSDPKEILKRKEEERKLKEAQEAAQPQPAEPPMQVAPPALPSAPPALTPQPSTPTPVIGQSEPVTPSLSGPQTSQE